MCYTLYLSTSSPEDLTKYNSDLIIFKRLDGEDNEYSSMLKNQEKWYVGSKSGCSCTFRHLASIELGFDEPQDWYPEDDDDLKATTDLFRVIARLVSQGNQVDCLDTWEGAVRDEIKAKIVNLNAVSEKTFRLFENYHFVFEQKDT